MTTLGPTKRAIYDYLKREGRSTLDEMIEALDEQPNQVYGCAKHLKWRDILGADQATNEEWWIETEVPGLCPECVSPTEYQSGPTIEEECPDCGWEETWTCPDCGSTDPHHSITAMDDELEVDVTCESVYIVPADGGNGFAFDHDEFEQVIEHYENRPDFES